MTNSILITGGAGFIGAYIAKRFLDIGFHVVIVDMLYDVGAISYIDPRSEFIKMSITDKKLYELLENYEFRAIYHLAAQSAGEPSYKDSFFDINTNAYGTFLVSQYAVKKRVPRLIYTSTVAVYGNAVNGSLNEESEINPDSIYGVSKYSGELFVRQMSKNSETEFSIFRVFNTFGPGENLNYQMKGMVSIYSSFIWRNEPIIVKGSLDRYRDISYIEDVVDILFMALENKKSYSQVYNLSSSEKITVEELLDHIKKAAKVKSSYPVIVSEGTPGDSHGFHANNRKLCNDFNWSKKYSISDGLKEYFDWIKNVPVKENISQYHPFNFKT